LAENNLLETWDEIAGFFRVSKRKIQRYRQDLIDYGAIFYRRDGRNPKSVKVCAYESKLIDWAGSLAKRGIVL
jgi:hypothetical protein